MRPIKERQIEQLPPVNLFKPCGVPWFAADEIVVTVEEMEAIRLADMEGLDQGPAAEIMGVSRPTFHRILTKAHTKVAQVLWQAKSLRVEGGTYRVKCCDSERKFRCGSCGHEWCVAKGAGGRGCQIKCPACGLQLAQRVL